MNLIIFIEISLHDSQRRKGEKIAIFPKFLRFGMEIWE